MRHEPLLIGLIGDQDSSVPAHRAIPIALQREAEETSIAARYEWVPTEEISTTDRLAEFDGIWCVPASPYRSMAGALLAIRHARENRVPFLGTCGGFQHALIEYARNVLGWSDADHAETAPGAPRAVIAALSCGLMSGDGIVRFVPSSRLRAIYGVAQVPEKYLCSYGLNPNFRAALVSGPLREAATDEAGDLRAVELDGHPFFIATLFQPERAALEGRAAPLVAEFLQACEDCRLGAARYLRDGV